MLRDVRTSRNIHLLYSRKLMETSIQHILFNLFFSLFLFCLAIAFEERLQYNMGLLRAQQQQAKCIPTGQPASDASPLKISNGISSASERIAEAVNDEWHPAEQQPDAPLPALSRTVQLSPLPLSAADQRGLELCRWHGRFQVVRPSSDLAFFLDGAHTDESIAVRRLLASCHLLVLCTAVHVLYSFENSAPKVSAILLSQYCSCAPSGIASEPVASRAHTRRALRCLCSTAPATETQNFFLSL